MLDLAVEPLANCVGKAVLEVVQQAREMSLEHLCLGDNRSQFAIECPGVPMLEANASNINVNLECLHAQETSTVFTPHFSQAQRAVRA